MDEKNKINTKRGRFEAHPINCDYRGFNFGNIFLIGDAAGLVSGFTGEGIYQALISGDVVARKIIDKNYSSKKIYDILWERRVHHFMLRGLLLIGGLRNIIFSIVLWSTKNKIVARFLLRILT